MSLHTLTPAERHAAAILVPRIVHDQGIRGWRGQQIHLCYPKCFLPAETGRWVKTDACCAVVDCPYCEAKAGTPCHKKGQPWTWSGSSHRDRRIAMWALVRSRMHEVEDDVHP